jgi:hypothetical protein
VCGQAARRQAVGGPLGVQPFVEAGDFGSLGLFEAGASETAGVVLGGFPRAVAAGGGVGKAGVAHGMILPFRLRSSADVRCFPGPRERWGWKGRSGFPGTRNATKLTALAISSVVLGGSRFRGREGAKLLGPLGAASAAICCASDASADAARRRLAARLPLASVGL